MQREDKLSSRRPGNAASASSEETFEAFVRSARVSCPDRENGLGDEREGSLPKTPGNVLRETDKLARRVGWNVVFLPHVDPCESHIVMILFPIAFASVRFRRGLLCLYPIHHLGEQCCQLATGSQVKRLFESVTVG